MAGEVQNFVPVTDAMLRNPDPGNWPMIRRDYSATSYSPLKEITPNNVKDLQMVWKSPMNEGGTNQPSPLAHNGTIYLNNTSGIIQAIDGRTGNLIWEHRLGGNIAMRGIALYDDKLFVTMSDANLVALDARTGKQVWKERMPDGREAAARELTSVLSTVLVKRSQHDVESRQRLVVVVESAVREDVDLDAVENRHAGKSIAQLIDELALLGDLIALERARRGRAG